MNSNFEQIHETVVKDIVDVLDGAKTLTTDMLSKKNTYRSIAHQASGMVLTFPVMVSKNIAIEHAAMVAKAVERKAVSLLTILFSGLSITKADNAIDFVKQFHNNINTSSGISLDDFIAHWTSEEKKETIQASFREKGIDLDALKAEQNMSDVDDFDFICHVAFDKKPLTRRERANNVKKRDFLSKYSGVARQVLEALLDKYMNTGIYEIEKTDILKLDPFLKLGKPSKIAGYFGGKEGYLKAVKELEDAIYAGEAI